MMTGEEFQKHLQGALNHLYEPRRLRGSPLAPLFGVSDRADTPQALQRILIEAIESFEPPADEPTDSRAWHIFGPLVYRYVEQLSQPEVASQLSLSVRHLRRKEHDALEALAARLWREYGLDTIAQEDTSVDSTGPTGAALQDEIGRLKGALQRGATDLGETLSGVIELVRGLAGRHDVDLKIASPGTLPQVAADAVAVRQALLNLLSVAIARARGGQVLLSVDVLDWEVELRVLSAEYPSGPKPALANETACLSAAQQLAALSGVRLSLTVDATKFDATLGIPAVGKLPVLLIDDNADTLQLLQRYASGTQYRIVAAQEPEHALVLAETTSPRVIVLDVMLPGIDGWEVLGRLRQSPATAHVPIVVCSVLAQEELAQFLGADAYIRKPVTRQGFLAVLDRQTQRAERESR